jgi:hypothetical protein
LLLVEVLAHPGEQRGEAVRVAGRHRQIDVLALATVPLRWHHHPPGDLVRDCGTELAPDVVQAGIDPGRRACAGDHPVVLDEQDVGVDRCGREAILQLFGVHPVCGAGASVEQACFTEQERPRADREQPGSARVRPSEDVEDLLRGPLVVVVGGCDQQVRALGSGEPVGSRQRHPVLELDRLARSLGADAEVDVGYAVVGAVDAEHLLDHAELEHCRAVRDHDGHAGKCHGVSMAENQREWSSCQ